MGRTGWIIMGGVIVLWLLGGVSCPGKRQIGRGAAATAETQVRFFAEALKRYCADVGAYPTRKQGLEALMDAPFDLKRPGAWKGTYLPDCTQVPLDPWGNAYLYETDETGGSCKVTSLGADGRPGGTDYAADIAVKLTPKS